jgi:hypothetical protein
MIFNYSNDSNGLVQFIEYVKEDLGDLIEWLPLLRKKDDNFNDLIVDAWGEVDRDILPSIIVNVNNENNYTELKDRGLTGKQLRLKLETYGMRRAEYKKALHLFDDDKRRSPLKKLYKLLDIITTIIGSIPGAEAIEEFLGIIINLLPDGRERKNKVSIQ